MIEIKKNPNGDTRTAPKDVTFEQFQEANDMHISDVRAVMYELSRMVDSAGEHHDCTKKSQERMFYRNFLSTINNGTDFVSDEWYKLHVKAERHHLLSNCPEDVNLIDVIEMLVDCVCAGMARSGEIRNLEIDDDILNRAVKNTVDLIKSMITVQDYKELNKDIPCVYTPITNPTIYTTITNPSDIRINHDTFLGSYKANACATCSNNPKNGGSGVCHCILGLPKVIC